jgi:hypothetical protein
MARRGRYRVHMALAGSFCPAGAFSFVAPTIGETGTMTATGTPSDTG